MPLQYSLEGVNNKTKLLVVNPVRPFGDTLTVAATRVLTCLKKNEAKAVADKVTPFQVIYSQDRL